VQRAIPRSGSAHPHHLNGGCLMDPKVLQQIADALTSLATAQHALASTQTLMSYTLIVFALGTLVCLGLLTRLTTDIHRQTTALLRGRE